MPEDKNYYLSRKQQLQLRAQTKINNFLQSVFDFVEDNKEIGQSIKEIDELLKAEPKIEPKAESKSK